MGRQGILAGLITFGMIAAPQAGAGVMTPEPEGVVQAQPTYRVATLIVGFAEVLDLPYPIDTVIVGDIGVLTATVLDGNSIVLTALSAGRTNVIILGDAGETLGRLAVRVREEPQQITSVYRGAQRVLLSCDPLCRPFAPEALAADR